jgi:hypothetical protein
MVQGSPSPIEGGGDNLLLLQEIFIPPVSCVGNGQPVKGGGTYLEAAILGENKTGVISLF